MTASPCPPEILSEIAELAQQDQRGALDMVERLLSDYADDAAVQFLHGSLLAAEKLYDAAEAAMSRAVRLAPDYAIARFQLGLLQLSNGAPAVAAATWAPLSRLPSEEPLRLFSEGLNEMARDRFDDAVVLLRRGISLNTSNAPLNRDMEMILAEIAHATASASTDEQLSPAQQLLQQSSTRRLH